MKTPKTIAKILSFVVAVLMLAMLVMQFMPFWTVEDHTVSIADYTWMTKEHRDLTAEFKAYYKEVYDIPYSTNYVFLMPVIVFVCCVIGTIMCCVKPGNWIYYLLPVVGGIYGAQGYLTNPLFQMGQNWVLHMVLCIAIAVVGAAGLACALIAVLNPKKK